MGCFSGSVSIPARAVAAVVSVAVVVLVAATMLAGGTGEAAEPVVGGLGQLCCRSLCFPPLPPLEHCIVLNRAAW